MNQKKYCRLVHVDDPGSLEHQMDKILELLRLLAHLAGGALQHLRPHAVHNRVFRQEATHHTIVRKGRLLLHGRQEAASFDDDGES